MSAFRVWAPAARDVALVVESRRLPLARDAGGWWSRTGGSPSIGQAYAVSVDGGEAVPDPRASRLPSGVDGPARMAAPAAQAGGADGFRAVPLERAVFYELHVGTFSEDGTYAGARAHLPHLRELGITHVELMPVNSFAGRHGWGYDGVGLFAPHEPYGTPDELRELVRECHAHGIAVVLDVVYNHLGPEGNHLGRFGPYFTDRYKTPWGQALNLDGADSDEVRRFVFDNAIMWLRDFGFDGLRLDAVHGVVDTSAIHWLEELSGEVRALARASGRELLLIAESDLNDPRLLRDVQQGGYGLDAQWSDEFHHALHALLTGERRGYYADFGEVAHLARAFRHAWVHAGVHSGFRRRRHGRPATGIPGKRFFAYAQNHDQIGNRARGERLVHLAGFAKARAAAALVLASPFVPLLFQGEEWGASTPFLFFADHRDRALREAVRTGRRQEFAAFGWGDDVPDPEDAATFEASRLRWRERDDGEHASLLAWTRQLVALRARHPAHADGDLAAAVDVACDEGQRWIRVRHGRLVLLASFADEVRSVPHDAGANARALVSDDRCDVRPSEVALAPWSAAVLET